jgi:hypothetical protein
MAAKIVGAATVARNQHALHCNQRILDASIVFCTEVQDAITEAKIIDMQQKMAAQND